MNIKHSFFLILSFVFLMIACGKNNGDENHIFQVDVTDKIINDSMIYGLACEGTSDSFIVVYPFSGEDPVTFSCIHAKKTGKIIGKPQIGDWVGIVLDSGDSTIAELVINLDQLKGTWTYPVMPTFKDFKNLSTKMRKRMEAQAIKELPDSEKALYLIPREYGFSLKRNHVAQPVGRVFTSTGINDDSPVEYPEVKKYQQWFSCNGRLILVSTTNYNQDATDNKEKMKICFDTLDYVSLDDDSLILTYHNKRIGFHRKNNAISANAEATRKAQEADKRAAENLKQ